QSRVRSAPAHACPARAPAARCREPPRADRVRPHAHSDRRAAASPRRAAIDGYQLGSACSRIFSPTIYRLLLPLAARERAEHHAAICQPGGDLRLRWELVSELGPNLSNVALPTAKRHRKGL